MTEQTPLKSNDMADPLVAARNRQKMLKTIAIYIFMTVLVIFYSLPLAGVVLTSLKTTADIAKDGLWTLPDTLHFENFATAWKDGNGQNYMINSFLVTIPATFLSIAMGVLSGYVFSKLSFKGSEALFVFVIAGMFFPPQIVLIPLFRLFNKIGLYDTLWPMIIVHIAFGIPICTLIMRNFFSTIPTAIRESALIDGANEIQILTRVMLPVSLPSLAVLATLQFTWIWNDFLWPTIFTQSDKWRTIMVGLVALKGQYSVAYGVQGAMALIASVPTLLIFVFFQRYFIRGLTLGSVKG
jgi:ABC-type glycerol-3-phosphate transport system permease component